ncbi:MAG TPA: ATP-binding protein [Bryobacteraceae bacterium]|jgi:signal transduction histidine kinase|nr:ATP-binding protein [Bryobacteraceae bacterium]
MLVVNGFHYTGVSVVFLKRLRPAVVLSAGFGGLILFIVAAAVGTLVQLDRVRGDETRIRQAFLGRLRTLEQIRSEIYLSGTDMRDFLLSPRPGDGDGPRRDIMAIRDKTQSALDLYAKSLDPEESDAFQALRSEIDAWWQAFETAFQWSPAEWQKRRFIFFDEQVVPRRITMLQIADRIAEINELGLTRAEDRMAASAESLRLSLLVTFGIAVLGGIVLAIAATALTLRLEREVERRLRETLEARSDLQALSARLVRAQEDERRTLARELHDEVGQSLSAIMMEAGSVRAAADAGEIAGQMGGDVRDRVSSIALMAEKTLNTVRDLALLLRPSMLDDFGLVPALNWHAREMTKRTGLNVRVAADEMADDLPDEHKTCIYRVVQEALHNAARHANARNLQVVVRSEGSRVVFSVRDDGSGFDKRFVRGLGMLGMEERVRRLGGEFRIDSEPGRGTTVSAELPLPEEREEDRPLASAARDRS